MSKTLRDEFEKEAKLKATISYGSSEIRGRFEGLYTLWLESALTTSRDENKRLREAIKQAIYRYRSGNGIYGIGTMLQEALTDHKEEKHT